MAASGALAVMAALAFGRFSYTVLLPPMREELGLSYTAAGFLATANLAGYLAGALAAGTVLRWVGPRGSAPCGLGILALSFAWTGGAEGVSDAAAARALAGAAGAVSYVHALGLVPQWFPREERGLASGVMHAGIGVGLALTGLGLPLLSGAVPATGWRVGWGALALATAGILPLGWACLRPPQAPVRVVVEPPAHPDQTPAGESRWGTSLPLLAGLYVLFGVSYVIYVTFFAEALRQRGLTSSQIGVGWAALGALSIASGPLGGRLSDRLGRLQGLAAIFGVQGVAYMAFLHGTPWGFLLSVVLFGTTAWGIPAIMAAAAGEIRQPADATTAFGHLTVAMSIGQALGPSLAGALADSTGIVDRGLWIAAVAALGGVVWSLGAALAGRRARHPG